MTLEEELAELADDLELPQRELKDSDGLFIDYYLQRIAQRRMCNQPDISVDDAFNELLHAGVVYIYLDVNTKQIAIAGMAQLKEH